MICTHFLTPSSEIEYRGEIRFPICNDFGNFVEMYTVKRSDVVKDGGSVIRKLKTKQWFKGKVAKEFTKYVEEARREQ